MTPEQIKIIVGIALYLLFAIGIGIWYARKSNRNSDEYFLGDRGLGPWVAAMSAEASDMSGWLLMGLPGVAYFTGAGEAVWTGIGLALGTWLNWKLVAVRLRKYSQIAGNAITLPDFFSSRFKDDKKILMTIASLIIPSSSRFMSAASSSRSASCSAISSVWISISRRWSSWVPSLS